MVEGLQLLAQELQLCLADPASLNLAGSFYKQAINLHKHAVLPYLIRNQTALGTATAPVFVNRPVRIYSSLGRLVIASDLHVIPK